MIFQREDVETTEAYYVKNQSIIYFRFIIISLVTEFICVFVSSAEAQAANINLFPVVGT